jgi:hypothetical protein
MLTGVMHGHAHDAASLWSVLASALPEGIGFFSVIFAIGMGFATFMKGRTRRSSLASSGDGRREAPWLAESLLRIFARTKDIEALIGDFEEYFERDCASGSERRAVARYWARVLRSLRPQIWQWINRVGWAALIAAVLKR